MTHPCQSCTHHRTGTNETAGYQSCVTFAMDPDITTPAYLNDQRRTMQRHDSQDRLREVWIRDDAALSCGDPTHAERTRVTLPTKAEARLLKRVGYQKGYRDRVRVKREAQPKGACQVCGCEVNGGTVRCRKHRNTRIEAKPRECNNASQ